MEEYKEVIKELFLRYYSPTGDVYGKKFFSTFEILKMIQGIIPAQPIGEHDIYEVMKEMGFQQELQIIYHKVCIHPGDEEKGIQPEYDNVEESRIFKWMVFEK